MTEHEGAALTEPATPGSAEGSRASDGKGSDADRSHLARMVLVMCLLAAGFALLPRLTNGCGGASANEDAPEFTGAVVANGEGAMEKSVALSSLRGHPVILDFWATWCGPCQAEAPIVNGLAQRYKDKGLVVIGVNTSDQPGLAERFVARKGLTFPIVFDQGNDIAAKYNVENLPTLYVLSKEGKIVAVRHGITSDADLERLVKKVL